MSEEQKLPEVFWKCKDCGFTLEALQPPEECPACHHTCEFINVTCYTPECGFQGIDLRLK